MNANQAHRQPIAGGQRKITSTAKTWWREGGGNGVVLMEQHNSDRERACSHTKKRNKLWYNKYRRDKIIKKRNKTDCQKKMVDWTTQIIARKSVYTRKERKRKYNKDSHRRDKKRYIKISLKIWLHCAYIYNWFLLGPFYLLSYCIFSYIELFIFLLSSILL